MKMQILFSPKLFFCRSLLSEVSEDDVKKDKKNIKLFCLHQLNVEMFVVIVYFDYVYVGLHVIYLPIHHRLTKIIVILVALCLLL